MKTKLTSKPRSLPAPAPLAARIAKAELGAKVCVVMPLKTQPPAGATELAVEFVHGKDTVTYRAFPGHGSARWAVCECPHKPSDVVAVKEAYASPSSHIAAYKAGGECGAWLGDGAGGRLWCHHGYIVEAPGYPFGLDTLRSWGLRKYGGKWRSARSMPLWAVRSHLRIEAVACKRVQDVTEEEIVASGTTYPVTEKRKPLIALTGKCPPAIYLRGRDVAKESFTHLELLRAHFASEFDTQRGKGSWHDNPWCFFLAAVKVTV